MKKIVYILVGILLLFFIHLTFRYTLNEIYIGKYNNENYDNGIVDFLHFLNYPESYIAHYNKGNNLYQTGEFESAVQEYEQALKTVKGDRRCKVEINLAFTKIELATDKKNNTIEVDKINEIQKILLDSDCATKDNKGKNRDAQRLYNELEKLKKNAQGDGGGGSDDNNDPDDNQGGSGNEKDYSDLEDKLRQQQIDGQKERQEYVNPREYEYYTGKSW